MGDNDALVHSILIQCGAHKPREIFTRSVKIQFQDKSLPRRRPEFKTRNCPPNKRNNYVQAL